VFWPLDPGDNPHRKEPTSEKKLGQGDGHWETHKLVLGWIINTIAMTIKLPPHRQAHLGELLQSIPLNQKRLSVRKWQQLLGELRSMAIAIPGSHGLFSWMQETLKHCSDNRIRLTQSVHDCSQDFRDLHHDLTVQPTRLFEIIPQALLTPVVMALVVLHFLCQVHQCGNNSTLMVVPVPAYWNPLSRALCHPLFGVLLSLPTSLPTLSPMTIHPGQSPTVTWNFWPPSSTKMRAGPCI
jgi:hypothetical protein